MKKETFRLRSEIANSVCLIQRLFINWFHLNINKPLCLLLQTFKEASFARPIQQVGTTNKHSGIFNSWNRGRRSVSRENSLRSLSYRSQHRYEENARNCRRLSLLLRRKHTHTSMIGEHGINTFFSLRIIAASVYHIHKIIDSMINEMRLHKYQFS